MPKKVKLVGLLIVFLIIVITALILTREKKQDSSLAEVSININPAISIGPADNHLQGFIFGIQPDPQEDQTKAISFLTDLKPNYWRLSTWGSYAQFVVNQAQFPQKVGTKIILLVQDAFHAQYGAPVTVNTATNGVCPSWSAHCFNTFADLKTAWAGSISKLMANVKGQSAAVAYYDILNEPDLDLLPMPPQFKLDNAEEILDLYQTAYTIIKQSDPGAKISGPSLSAFRDGANISAFLTYTKQNNLKLDALSWHEFGWPENIPAHMEKARDLMSQILACGRDCPQIHINEYQPDTGHLIPALALGYLYYLNAGKADEASRACFTVGGFDNCRFGVDGLLSKDGTQTQNIYWVYKAYADLSGQFIQSTSTNPRVVALTAYDQTKGELRAIIGNYSSAATNLSLDIQNYPFVSQPVTITLQKIPNTNNQVSYLSAPVAVSTFVKTISLANFNLKMNNVKSGEAYVLLVKKK